MATFIPFLLAIPHALEAHPKDPFSGMAGAGGLIGVNFVGRIRHPEVRALGSHRRRLLRQTVSTGHTSRDVEVDAIALGLLNEQARLASANAITIAVTVVAVLGIGVVAAVRSGHWWWAAAVAPAVLFSVATLAMQIVRPPGDRIARLVHIRACH